VNDRGHQRADWSWARSKSFKSEPPARRLFDRLLQGGWFDTLPVIYVVLTRQTLGEPEVVERWVEEREPARYSTIAELLAGEDDL